MRKILRPRGSRAEGCCSFFVIFQKTLDFSGKFEYDIQADFEYRNGEVAELAEGARLEIV